MAVNKKKVIIRIIVIAAIVAAILICIASCDVADGGIGPKADAKLMRAISFGNAEACREAIAEGANINRLGGMLGTSIGTTKREKNPIRIASDNLSKLRLVYILLDAGADPNVIDVEGDSIFANAVRIGDFKLCTRMLEKGADINLKDKNGRTPLDSCFLGKYYIAEEMYDFLIENGAKVTPETLDWIFATNWRYENSVVAESRGNTPGYSLVKRIVKDLDKTGQPINIDPLIKAIILGNETEAMRLVKNETEYDIRCLFYTAAFGTPELLDALFKDGRELSEKDLNNAGLFAIAAQCGNINMLEYLLQNYDIKSSEQNDALEMAVIYNQIDAVRFLIAGIERPESDLLAYACRNGNVDMVNLLIENRDFQKGYQQAAEWACEYDQPECLELIIEAAMDENGNVGLSLEEPMIDAAICGSKDSIILLVQNVAENDMSDKLASPLTYACSNGKFEIAEYLIQHGADINPSPEEIWAGPLYYAIGAGELDIVELLVENGAIIKEEFLSWGFAKVSDNIYQYLISESEMQKTLNS